MPPFVGRNRELAELQAAVEEAGDEGSFYAITAVSGLGKTTLLNEFQQYCEDQNDTTVFRFDFSQELIEVQQFVVQFEEQWRKSYPQKPTEKAVGYLKENTAHIMDIAGKVSGFVNPGLAGGLSLGSTLLEDEENGETTVHRVSSDVLVEFLDTFGDFGDSDNLVILFDDYHKIPPENREQFDYLMQSLSEHIPDNVVCCVAAEKRFYDGYEDTVEEIELAELRLEDISEYLDRCGFSAESETVNKVFKATGGNPYSLRLLKEVADEDGLRTAVRDLPDTDIDQYLNQRFLQRLSRDEEEFLYSICALPEFNIDLVTELTDRSPVEARRLLREIHNKAIIERLGIYNGKPVFRPHNLLSDHLQRYIGQRAVNKQHRQASVYYAEQMSSDRWDEAIDELLNWVFGSRKGSSPLTADSFVETLSDSIAAGYMFDYHIEEISSGENKAKRIVNILEQSELDPTSSLSSFGIYYSDVDEETWTKVRKIIGEELEVEISLPDEITESQLSEAQLTCLSALVEGLSVGDTEVSKSEKLEILREQQDQVREVMNEPEVDRISRIIFLGLQFQASSLREDVEGTEGGESGSIPTAAFLKEEYGFSESDLIYTGYLLDLLTSIVNIEQIEFEPEIDVDKKIETLGELSGRHAVVEEKARSFLTTIKQMREGEYISGEDIKTLETAGLELTAYFANQGHPSLAAALRDVVLHIAAYLDGEQDLQDAVDDLSVTQVPEMQQMEAMLKPMLHDG